MRNGTCNPMCSARPLRNFCSAPPPAPHRKTPGHPETQGSHRNLISYRSRDAGTACLRSAVRGVGEAIEGAAGTSACTRVGASSCATQYRVRRIVCAWLMALLNEPSRCHADLALGVAANPNPLTEQSKQVASTVLSAWLAHTTLDNQTYTEVSHATLRSIDLKGGAVKGAGLARHALRPIPQERKQVTERVSSSACRARHGWSSSSAKEHNKPSQRAATAKTTPRFKPTLAPARMIEGHTSTTYRWIVHGYRQS